MATYTVKIRKRAIKVLKKVPDPFYSKIKSAIYGLTDNPRPKGCKKLKGRKAYRIRVGNYRVIYEIFDSMLVVDVINVGHRKDIYK